MVAGPSATETPTPFKNPLPSHYHRDALSIFQCGQSERSLHVSWILPLLGLCFSLSGTRCRLAGLDVYYTPGGRTLRGTCRPGIVLAHTALQVPRATDIVTTVIVAAEDVNEEHSAGRDGMAKNTEASCAVVPVRAWTAGSGPGGAGSQALPADRPVDGGAGFFVREVRSMSRHKRRDMIDRGHSELSVVRQCGLLDISRSSVYYNPVGASEYELGLIDRQYLQSPFYGSRKITACLRRQGHQVSRKRVQR